MPFPISARVRDLVQSPIRAMTRACNAVGGINMGQGVCQMPPPPEIVDAAVRALREGGMAAHMYAKYEGVDELRREIGRKLERWNGLRVDVDREVNVTPGVSGAFAAAAMALLEPGDEVILFEPFYGYHVNTLLLAGAVPRFVPLAPRAWPFDADALRRACGPRTRAVLVNSPANPSGKVWSRAELTALASVAQERDLLVFTDEIYEFIVYEGEHISPATIPGLRERCVSMFGLSKTFSITGWRLGYCVAPEALSRPIGLVNDLLCVCAATPLQYAAAAAMVALPDAYYRDLAAKYRSKRDRTCAALRKAGLEPLDPQGAYYVLADASRLGCADDQAAADEILRRARVASVPGRAFLHGDAGRQIVRFCFALEDGPLDEACRRLAAMG